jgi:hypothetical protein
MGSFSPSSDRRAISTLVSKARAALLEVEGADLRKDFTLKAGVR